MGLFDITLDDIEHEKKSGFYELVDGHEYTFMINEVEERDDDSVIIKTIITSNGEGNGRNYNIFINNNEFGKDTIIKILKLHYSMEEIIEGLSPVNLISYSFSATAKKTKSKKDPSKEFVNLRDYKVAGVCDDDDLSDQDAFDKATSEKKVEKKVEEKNEEDSLLF